MSAITIDSLAWEMCCWECHALRNELQASTLSVELYAHTHPSARPMLLEMVESKERMDTAQLAALRDPSKRKARPHES